MIFIIAVAVMVILSAMLLVFAQEMRTESTASANRLSEAEASCVEMGAEQWTLAQVETFTTPVTGSAGANNVGVGQVDITQIPAAGIQVGDPKAGGGYFWLLNPDPAQDQTYRFGIADEGAKLNVNVATNAQIANLPGVAQDVADCITDWIDTDENPTGTDGAESSYYGTLGAEAYTAKNSGLDTVDELLLVRGVTPAVLYGMDLNRDGVIDDAEQTLGAGATPAVNLNGVNDRRGVFNYVTCYTTRNPPGQVAVQGGGRPGVVPQQIVGLININTAPLAVLACLPGLQQADAQSMVDQRTQSAIDGSSNDLTWARTALGGRYASIAPYVTAQSYQYSADIVAVSGDGRSFKRVRIVVDARTQPAKIVYHKDLTALGWPLPPDVRTSLRTGQGLPPDAGVTAAGTGVNSAIGGLP